MSSFDFPRRVDDTAARRKVVDLLRRRQIILPRFAELADPGKIPPSMDARLADVLPDMADPANLFRVHWFNDGARLGRRSRPLHIILPEALTGVRAKIAVALGAFFPMAGAHKVLPAYSCLVPRLVSGRFDPDSQLAVWPSTGNYCRGGVAISRILGCRAVAVLPEGMSDERFAWLSEWVSDPADIVRTPGTESNVKEIFDACDALARDPANEIVNQFSDFGNYLGHYACTGPALENIFQSLAGNGSGPRPFAFVAASGSSGTLAAGDYLKDRLGTKIVVVEPVECPTLLYNGFGEHNIQGIGDKHVPLIHNVMNADFVIAVTDKASDGLNAAFNSVEGRAHLAEQRGLSAELLAMLRFVGLSGIANILAAIKLAKYYDLGDDDVVLTLATDGAALYDSERQAYLARNFPSGFTGLDAAGLIARHLDGADTDHMLDLTETDRARIFNLGYYTWVEQRGVALADFEARRAQSFWRDLHQLIPVWDDMIESVNRDAGVLERF
jgi:cysteine synthase